MDPKMDSGMASDQDLILEHFDPFKHVQPVEIIAIMDQLLCFEASIMPRRESNDMIDFDTDSLACWQSALADSVHIATFTLSALIRAATA